MRINTINSMDKLYGVNNSLKFKSVKTNDIFNMPEDTISFKGYNSAYKKAATMDFSKFTNVQLMFKELFNAAEKEPGVSVAFKDIFRDVSDLRATLKRAAFYHGDNKKCEVVMASSKYEPPLVEVEEEGIIFRDPIYGIAGRGNIVFSMEKGKVSVNRGHDFHEFFPSGNLRLRWDFIADNRENGGGITNKKYYKEDGSEDFWRNYFLG